VTKDSLAALVQSYYCHLEDIVGTAAPDQVHVSQGERTDACIRPLVCVTPGSLGHGKPGKVMEKTSITKVLEKSCKCCYNHVFIYTPFEIINMFFKERRSKYEPAYALDTQHVLNVSCSYREFSLVLDMWLKVLEMHWSTCVEP